MASIPVVKMFAVAMPDEQRAQAVRALEFLFSLLRSESAPDDIAEKYAKAEEETKKDLAALDAMPAT